jgi:predicted nucleic acid-binding protein
MTYLIDTDVMVDFFKHKDPAKELIARLSKHAVLLKVYRLNDVFKQQVSIF